MDLSEAILSRRSIRKFKSIMIDNEVLNSIINAGIHSPSACDRQAWRFIVITDNKVKQRIVDSGAARFILGAPAGILVLYDNRTDNTEFSDHIQSASACIENMVLEAWSRRVGACWVCHLPTKRQLRNILKIPKYYDPVAYIAMGYFDMYPAIRERKHKVEDVVSYNRFYEKSYEKVRFLFFKRLFRKIYYLLPFRKYIKKNVDNLFEKKFE